MDTFFNIDGWYDPDGSSNSIISMNIAAVDGNGEVISANPYISSGTEKDTAGGENDLGVTIDPKSDIDYDIMNVHDGQDPYSTDPENDDFTEGDVSIQPNDLSLLLF